MTSKFKELQQLTNFLDFSSPEDLNKLEKSLTPVLLCWYASIGDLTSLKELIELGVDLNLKDYDNRSALHLAAAEDQIKVLDLLCIHNVEIFPDKRGECPFFDAIRSESFEAMMQLKHKFGQADISRLNSHEIATEMCIAVALNDVQKIQLFIDAKVPVSLADYDCRTPLHIASNNGNTLIYQMLIEAGADRDAVDNFGKIPIMEVAKI